PPIVLRKDLDFLRPEKARVLDHLPNGGQIDNPIAHHAAIKQHVLGRHQPVADVMRKNPLHAPGAGNSPTEVRVPPDMVDVDSNTHRLAEHFTDVERLIDGVY